MDETQALAPRIKGDSRTDLPSGWRSVPLAKVATFCKKPRRLDLSACGEITFVPMEAIPQAEFYLKKWDLRQPRNVRSGVYFTDGDILLAKITPCLENGKQCIAIGVPNGWGIATTEVFPLHPVDIVPEFLALHLKLPEVRQFLASRMEGSTGRRRLPRPVIEQLTIPVPGVDEQREIVNVLRAVQQAREASERVIAATRELKRSLMRHLFTYGSVSVDRAKDVVLKETEIGLLPDHWKMVRFSDVLLGGTQNGIYKSRSSYGSGVPIVDMIDIFRSDILAAPADRLSLASVEIDKYGLRKGDLLFARRSFKPSGSGKCQLVKDLSEPTVFSSSIIRTSPDPSKVDSKYLHSFFTSSLGREVVGRIIRHLAVSGISGGDLKDIPVPLPPLTEQRLIAEQLALLNNKLLAEEHCQSATTLLFESLLHDLMTGKRRVDTSELIHG